MEEYCRPVLQEFARLMETRLRQNDHKLGWRGDPAAVLFDRLEEEVSELRTAIGIRYEKGRYDIIQDLQLPPRRVVGVAEPVSRILAEAADVANFAMMIVDVSQEPPPMANGGCGASGHKTGGGDREGTCWCQTCEEIRITRKLREHTCEEIIRHAEEAGIEAARRTHKEPTNDR